MEDKRKVTRVLVMLEYGPEDPQSGEVFDLTALTTELAQRPGSKHNCADITLEVRAHSDYDQPRGEKGWPTGTDVSWRASIDFDGSGRAAHLDDAINASMPDSFTTTEMRKKLKRIKTKAEQISADIAIQRLRDAAAVRYQHPIARVQESPALAEVAGKVSQ